MGAKEIIKLFSKSTTLKSYFASKLKLHFGNLALLADERSFKLNINPKNI